LRAVTKPGDIVAIESPAYFGALQIFESLGLQALELPTHPREGLSLEALEVALESHRISACLLMPNLANPLGSTMPDARKQLLVEMLSAREIPLIEDDTYGDLSFARRDRAPANRSIPAATFCYARRFQKRWGRGYAWAGRRRATTLKEALWLKTTLNFASASLPPLAVVEFLQNGGYEHYLRRTRKLYISQLNHVIGAITKYFSRRHSFRSTYRRLSDVG
jgi:DNA-binding transcriptional MocR family regulator